MAVVRRLDDDECYLAAILDDPSGIELAELTWVDEESEDRCYRVWDFQHVMYGSDETYQIDQCGRSLGKSVGIIMRAYAFPFHYPGAEMLITAPELNHLRPIVDKVENLFLSTRLGREMLPKTKGNGINHQPQFQARFINNSRIISRLPNRDGKGVKGMHPLVIELDEGQDFPEAGWVEIIETMKSGSKGAQWRVHGVSRGVRDTYYKMTTGENPDLPFYVHRYMAPHRPSWTTKERRAKIAMYGGTSENVDYRRNIYGEHGDAYNPLFVLARLMQCWLPEAIIHTQENGIVRHKPIKDIQVGDTVRNAVGVGTVTAVITSQRDALIRLTLDGDDVHCTPEHPLFTDHGWRHADQLRPGDRVFTGAGLRELWASADLREAATLLLSQVLGGIHPGAGEDLPQLRHELPDLPAQDVLLPSVRRTGQAHRQPQAQPVLPVLWQADPRRARQLPLLRPEVLERQPATGPRRSDLQAVRLHLPRQGDAEVLLAQLLREVGRTHLRTHLGLEPLLQDVRALRDRVLQSGLEGQVLLEDLREHRHSEPQGAADEVVRALQYEFQARSADAQVLQQDLLVRHEGQEPSRAAATLDERRARRTSARPIRAVDGPRGPRIRLGAGVLDESYGGHPGDHQSDSRPGTPVAQVGRRGGWTRTQQDRGQATRLLARSVAAFARVDGAARLERGSEDFTALSGGEDQVTVYDLTVSGHPSFLVGKAGVLSHNCVRINESSWATQYNEDVYAKIKINDEQLRRGGLGIESYLDNIPQSHLNEQYTSFWAGMDVGYTNDPSEILVWATLPRRGKPDLLRMLTRVQLQRISARDQCDVIKGLVGFYGDRLRRFGMDKTGNGLPLFQFLRDDPDPWASRALRVIQGYGFSEKLPVEFDDRVPEHRETAEDLVIERNIVDFASDELRKVVDDNTLELPYDTEVLTEFQGQSVQVVKDMGSAAGIRRKYSSQSPVHTLDAARMLIAAKQLEAIEAALAKKRWTPVLDAFYG